MDCKSQKESKVFSLQFILRSKTKRQPAGLFLGELDTVWRTVNGGGELVKKTFVKQQREPETKFLVCAFESFDTKVSDVKCVIILSNANSIA